MAAVANQAAADRIIDHRDTPILTSFRGRVHNHFVIGGRHKPAGFLKSACSLVPHGLRHHLPLFLILALAAVVRLWGITFGLPHTLCRPDETTIFELAFLFFRGHFKINFFAYPTLFMYFLAALYGISFIVGRLVGLFSAKAAFVSLAASDPSPFLLIDRIASAAAGVASVALLYLIGRRLFDRTTALVGAAFLALASLHVRDSHFGVTDVPATCLILASFLYTVRFAQEERLKDLWRSAAFAGLAAATKYNALVIALPAAAVVFGLGLKSAAGRWPARIRRFLLFGLVTVLAFLAGMPFALVNWHQFLAGFSEEYSHLMAGHGLLLGRGWVVHLTMSLRYGLGLPLLFASLVGLAGMARISLRRAILVGLFPVIYFVMIGRGLTGFARYMLPVIPFLCLTGAWAVAWLSSVLASATGRSKWAIGITVMLAVLVIAPSAWNVVQIDRLLATTDSRLLAAAWLRTNLPEGATVYQTGRIYAQVQLKALPQVSPGSEWGFDELEFRFTRGGVASPAQPDVVLVETSPLELYTSVPRGLDAVLARDYRLVQHIQAYNPAAASGVFDWIDAFFLPLSGFRAIARPGPNIDIYRRRADIQGPP